MNNPTGISAVTIDDQGNITPAKKKLPAYKMAGGYIATALTAAAAATVADGQLNLYDLVKSELFDHPAAGPAVDISSNAPTTITAIEIPDDAKVATGVHDSMSFADAYAAARQEVGSGGVFAWHGDVFNTYNTAEWAQLTPEMKDAFYDAVPEHLAVPDYTPPTQDAQTDDGKHDVFDSLVLDPTPEAAPQTQQQTAQQAPSDDDGLPVVVAGETTVTPEDFAAAPTFAVVADVPIAGQAPLPSGVQLVDVNNDGIADGLGVDPDNDNKINVVIVDANNDGKPEQLMYDTDNDNKIDVVASDLGDDGAALSIDPVGPAPADDFDINNPDAAEFDPNADISDWK